jgi:hypothetical protein
MLEQEEMVRPVEPCSTDPGSGRFALPALKKEVNGVPRRTRFD